MSAGPTGFDRWDLESHISKAISELSLIHISEPTRPY